MPISLNMEDVRLARALADSLLCRYCRLTPPAYERAVSYTTYRGPMRVLIHLLKFRGLRQTARVLVPGMVDAILRLRESAGQKCLVMAVPLHGARAADRGFNQAQVLADAALRVLRHQEPAWDLTPAHTLLRRTRATETQRMLSRKGRRRNLLGAFAADASVAGHEVILVDDIMTTGATAEACARALRRAGAAKVWVATLARAQRVDAMLGQAPHHAAAHIETARWDMSAREGAGA